MVSPGTLEIEFGGIRDDDPTDTVSIEAGEKHTIEVARRKGN